MQKIFIISLFLTVCFVSNAQFNKKSFLLDFALDRTGKRTSSYNYINGKYGFDNQFDMRLGGQYLPSEKYSIGLELIYGTRQNHLSYYDDTDSSKNIVGRNSQKHKNYGLELSGTRYFNIKEGFFSYMSSSVSVLLGKVHHLSSTTNQPADEWTSSESSFAARLSGGLGYVFNSKLFIKAQVTLVDFIYGKQPYSNASNSKSAYNIEERVGRFRLNGSYALSFGYWLGKKKKTTEEIPKTE